MQEAEGLFNNFDLRRGILLSQPLVSDWATEIRWEGEKRGAAARVGGGDDGATIATAESSPALPKKVL
jgi:hypothetical protein